MQSEYNKTNVHKRQNNNNHFEGGIYNETKENS